MITNGVYLKRAWSPSSRQLIVAFGLSIFWMSPVFVEVYVYEDGSLASINHFDVNTQMDAISAFAQSQFGIFAVGLVLSVLSLLSWRTRNKVSVEVSRNRIQINSVMHEYIAYQNEVEAIDERTLRAKLRKRRSRIPFLGWTGYAVGSEISVRVDESRAILDIQYHRIQKWATDDEQ